MLTIEHTPSADAVYYCYWAPYSLERLADLVGEITARAISPNAVPVRSLVLGQTAEGRDIDLLVVGTPADGKMKARGALDSRPMMNPARAALAVAPTRPLARNRPQVWLNGRQHPGETQASFWIEGVLRRLTDTSDAVAQARRNHRVATACLAAA